MCLLYIIYVDVFVFLNSDRYVFLIIFFVEILLVCKGIDSVNMIYL